MKLHGDWGLGIGDWGLGIGDWGQWTIANFQIPMSHAHCMTEYFRFII